MAQGSSNPTTDLRKIGGVDIVDGGTDGTQAIGGIQAHSAAISNNNPVLIGGYANTSAPPAVSDGDLSQIWLTANGAVNIADGGSSLTVDGSLTGVGTVTTVSTVTNLSQLGGAAISMGSGTRDSGTQRVTVATDDVVQVADNGSSLTVDDGGSSLTVDGTVAATQSGSWVITSLTQINGNVISTGSGTRDSGTQRVTIATDDTIAAVTNLAQLNGQAIAMGTGARSAGTQRVTIATDDTIAAVTNLAQLGGAAIAMGSGTRSAGTQRVTIATDDVVPASQSGTWNINTVSTVTNLSQLGGAAIAMGSGTRSAGTQRVTIATDDLVPVSDNGGSLTVDDGGSSLTVDGTVAATQSGTWNIDTVSTVTGVTTVSTVTNLSQLGGAAIAMGTGTRSAGTQRVTIATDDLVPVSDNGGSLTVDDGGSSITVDGSLTTVSTVTNLAQLGGTAISMGSGVRDSGTQRVTIATNDSVAVTGTFWQTTQPVSLSGTVTTQPLATASFQNALSSAGSGFSIALNGALGAAVQIVGTNSPTGYTVEPRVSYDGGTNFTATNFYRHSDGQVFPTLTNSNPGFSTGQAYSIELGNGATNVQIFCTARSTGSVTFQLSATNSQGLVNIKSEHLHDAVSGENLMLIGGYASSSAPTSVASGDAVRLWASTEGELNVISRPGDPSATLYPLTNASSTAYSASLVIKAGAGKLFMLTGYSSRISSQWIHLFNSTSLPANGTAPVLIFRVPADSNFSINFGEYGRYFSTGIVAACSTNGPTLTLGSSDCWFDAQYR